MTLKVEGSLGGEENGVLRYLKRQIEFADDGLYITQWPLLLELLLLEGRRGKSTPSHHGLEVYEKDNAMDEEYLGEK